MFNVITDYVDRKVDTVQNTHKRAHGVENLKRLNITLFIPVLPHQIKFTFLYR